MPSRLQARACPRFGVGKIRQPSYSVLGLSIIPVHAFFAVQADDTVRSVNTSVSISALNREEEAEQCFEMTAE